MRAAKSTPLLATILCLVGCSQAATTSLPVAPSMSVQQKSAAYTDALDARWKDIAAQYPLAVRPAIDRIRYVAPGDMPSAMAECLHTAGFEASVTTDAEGLGFTASSVKGQEEALAVAWYACEAQYPVDPEFTQPLTIDEIAFMYNYNVNTLLPCLRKLGYATSEVPTLQRYQDTFGTAKGWFPYADVYPLGQEATDAASKACPQNPPGFRE